jgi:hypothetical protein
VSRRRWAIGQIRRAAALGLISVIFSIAWIRIDEQLVG